MLAIKVLNEIPKYHKFLAGGTLDASVIANLFVVNFGLSEKNLLAPVVHHSTRNGEHVTDHSCENRRSI